MQHLLATAFFVLHGLLPGTPMVAELSSRLTQQAAAARPAEQQSTSVETAYSQLPTKSATAKPYVATATAATIYDRSSSSFLYEKAAHEQRPVASITKIATALTLLDSHSLDEIVTVPKLPAAGIYDQSLRIQTGDRFTLREAMRGMLIYSANDMAQALAIWDSGSEAAFARKMNGQVDRWGLRETNFVNPTGLDADGAHSSAHDLTVLASLLLQNKFFADTVATPRASIQTLSGKRYLATTTNQLLGNGVVYGIKTGFTLQAGESLLSLAKRDGHELIGVVLNSPDRFKESQSMLNWAFANYIWK